MLSPRDTARAFLAAVYPPETSQGLGYRTLWYTPSKSTEHIIVADVDQAADTALALDAAGNDVYLGVALRREPGRGRGKATEVSALPGFWADIDIRGLTHPEETRAPDYDEGAAILDDFGLPPTLVVDSGYGLHAWWLYEKPLVVTDENRDEVIARCEAFDAAMVAAGARRGWQVDKVGDITRVLRLPGLSNRKLAGPRPVTLLLNDGPRYPFDVVIPNLGAKVKASTPPRKATVDPDPAVGEVVALDDLRARFGNLKRQPELRPHAQAVLRGEVFGEPGQRDDYLTRLTSSIARLAPWNNPVEIAVEIFGPSLVALKDADPAKHTESIEELVANTADKVARAQEKWRPEAAAQKTKDAAMLTTLRAAACRRLRVQFPPPGVSVEEAEARSVEGDDTSGGDYTDEEIAGFAKALKCTPEELQKRWIIQKSRSYYVLVNGVYRPPKIREELENCLEDWLRPTSVQFWSSRQDGSLKRKPLTEVTRDITTVVDNILADMTIERSYYDDATSTFHERVCAERPIKPAYDPMVDKWLRLLGSADAEKLLDWIATVTRLELQTAALYLAGEPGTGKGMLAHGLSRIWSERGPVELPRILEKFNSDLLYCPLAWADEEVPVPKDGTSTSGQLRQAVGNSSRTLSRKYQDNATIVGCYRIMLCANNDEILSLGEQVLAAMELSAVAGRILHITVGREAARYLVSIGGRSGTDDWVSGDRIAAHALWLRANRQVVPGNRFLVEGYETKMHRKLVIQGRVASRCVEWLARFLDEPIPVLWDKKQAKGGVPLVILGNGRYLVNTTALVDNWKAKVKTDQNVPSTTHIGRSLTNLSTGSERVGNLRYHVIRVDQVLDWADESQIGDSERMRFNLVQPPDTEKATSGKPQKTQEEIDNGIRKVLTFKRPEDQSKGGSS